ncbi:MAG TPA: DNA repair protein RecO [Nitrospirales bacterium]|nr:DNA repair protein RecO [Nitrospirales bacterium]
MSLLKTPAITLKSRKWGDADRIVTFYTLRFGKLRGVARGARRMKSRFGSALEPFVHSELNLFEKANDHLYRITQADIRKSCAALREDLTRMSAAGRLVNLVAALTGEGDACVKVYDALSAGLLQIEQQREDSDVGLTTLLFQIRLLGLTGFRPRLDPCAACGKPRNEPAGRFASIAGGLVCQRCANRPGERTWSLSPGSVAVLRHALEWSPAVLTRLKATGQVRDELDKAIESYITTVAGKRLPPIDFLVAAERQAVYERSIPTRVVGRDDRGIY